MPDPRPLLWSGPALGDLREIREYVRRDSPSAARRLAERIRERTRLLREHPRAGRVVPGFEEEGLREVVVAPYRIVYEVREDAVVIVRVWHGRRDLSGEALGGDLEDDAS